VSVTGPEEILPNRIIRVARLPVRQEPQKARTPEDHRGKDDQEDTGEPSRFSSDHGIPPLYEWRVEPSVTARSGPAGGASPPPPHR
jgi:hypothetical protein